MKLTDELCDAIAECARRWRWERLGEASARERIREDLTHVFASIPEPTDTVLELNKRITALQMRLDRACTWLDTYALEEDGVPRKAVCDELNSILYGLKP